MTTHHIKGENGKPVAITPLPPCAEQFRPRWPGDEGGYTAQQMIEYARAALDQANQTNLSPASKIANSTASARLKP